MKSLSDVSRQPATRLYALDALRGLAAMGVAFFWHFTHFCNDNRCRPSQLPFYHDMHWLYTYGYDLVDLFFVLSGFIFMWKYADGIAAGTISFRQFAIFRLTRLYPLHLLTLLIVTGEMLWMAHHGHQFVYQQASDGLHFVMNLLMVQSGWFDSIQTFNGPSWSIATEVILYLLFFGLLRRLKTRAAFNIACLVGIYVGFAQLYRGTEFWMLNNFTARGLLGFFAGCLTCQFSEILTQNPAWSRAFQIGFVAVVAAVAGLCTQMSFERLFGNYVIVFSLAFYPALLLFSIHNTLARAVLSVKPLRILGDCSYSLYLWHIPIQMVLFALYGVYHLNPHRRLGWEIFVGSVLGMAYLSHYYFEMPVQRKLRRYFLAPAAVAPPAQAWVAAREQTAPSIAGD